MFETIRIENFKSIIEADINLSPLTVIVGANGSGKSNLIKALEFLSSVPSIGLVRTVNRYGGFRSLIPKAVPTADLAKTRIRLRHRSLLPRLKGYDQDLPPLAVEHELQLAHATQESIRVTREKLEFHQPLAVAEVIGSGRDEDKIDKGLLAEKSVFWLERGSGGAVRYGSDPPFAKAISAYLQWLGLAFTRESVTSVSALKKLLESMIETRRTLRPTTARRDQRYVSFLDPRVPTVVDYAPQAQIFRTMLMGVRRYDLLLSELRPEQQVSETRRLSTVGNNMPSVLRNIRSSEKAWSRILGTLGVIAPHVESVKPSSLRTGKEFVEFVESTASRGVESWESSDGTLRALAILLALETHRPSSTILIEEPEQNLHPWAVREIVEHIREVIKRRNVQVVVTTHSQQVLERVYPEEVLVATRTRQGGTAFRTLQEILPHSQIVMGEVAELWVKGLLGGVPSDEC